MSETAPQEPTMEEILASIRRIISEDDSPADVTAAPEADAGAPDETPQVTSGTEAVVEPVVVAAPPPVVAAPSPAPVVAAPAPVAQIEEDDDLELTQKVESLGDLDVIEAEAPPSPPTLVSETVAAAAAASFGQLSATIAMPATDRTLEDVVREMLRPMLQQWLDANLPGIVQDAVQTEVDRIARSRVR